MATKCSKVKKVAKELKKHEAKDKTMYSKIAKLSKRSHAQNKALKGKSVKKKDEIKGGEKANIKLRKERKARK